MLDDVAWLMIGWFCANGELGSLARFLQSILCQATVMTSSEGDAASPRSSAPEQASRRLWWAIGLLALAAAGVIAAVASQFLDADKTQGLELAKKGRFTQAEPLLQRSLARHPQDVEVVRTLALGYLGLGRNADAEPLLSRWCELQPQDAEPFRRRMEFYRDRRQFPLAVADGLRVLEFEPNNVEVGKDVAPMLLITGRLEEAEREARRWLQQAPDNPRLLYLLADVSHQRGNNAEAEAVLDRLLLAQPESPDALLLRGILYQEADNSAQAIPVLRHVLALPPPPSQQLAACYYLSLALSRTGQADEAKRVLAQVQWHQAADLMARKEHPQTPALLLWVAEAKLSADEPQQTQESVDLLGRIMSQDPNCAPEAVRLLEKAVAKEPKLSAAHRLLADYYEKQGNSTLAAEHRRKAKS